MDGVAGAGKTTTLAVVREGAEQAGYKVEGFAPTSRAAQKLGEAGIETKTLQAHLARGQRADTGEHRLYVMDESSLASTKQMHEFVSRLHPNDRVLLVGDTRQHESVEAGRIFAQLQDAGMKTVKLEEIVRQRDPELKQTVEQLARGQVGEAIAGLERQGRIHEVPGHEDRIAAIAKEYAKSPDNTLVVSPDNRSRAEINQAIHAELQAKGVVGREEHRTQVLVPRQDLTGADRIWAARYNEGDVLRYSRSSQETGIAKGEYARVTRVDAPNNRLTVERKDGTEQSYDPRRQQGVSVYREQERAFSVGDWVQLTAPSPDLKLANRELGTVEGIGQDGRMSFRCVLHLAESRYTHNGSRRAGVYHVRNHREFQAKKPGRQRRRQRKHNANVDSGGGRNLRRSFFPERSRETRHGDGANRPDRIRTETTSSRDVS